MSPASSLPLSARSAPTSPARVVLPVRPCGRFDLRLPVLGIGCWAFGGGDYWGAQDQTEVNAIVREAVEHGCTFFDTAEAYNRGASEASLGHALRGIPRDRVVIGTKISPSNAAPPAIVAHCEASLRRLRTDYIDLYMVHWPITAHSILHFSPDMAQVPVVEEAFAALDRLRRQGKIRHIGVSNFGRARLEQAISTGVQIVVNELPYSLLARAVELDILPYCRAHGIGVLGYMSLLQGVLGDRYRLLSELPECRRRTRHFASSSTRFSRHGLPGFEAETQAALDAVRKVAAGLGLSTAELSLKWAIAGEGITSALCGVRTLDALRVNVRAACEPLAASVVQELNRLTQPLLAAMGPSFDYYEHPDNDRTR